MLGKPKNTKILEITPTVFQGWKFTTPVKTNFIHLGNLELKSPLDPLTTPLKKLVNSATPNCKENIKKTSQRESSRKRPVENIKKFKLKSSPLRKELFKANEEDLLDSIDTDKTCKKIMSGEVIVDSSPGLCNGDKDRVERNDSSIVKSIEGVFIECNISRIIESTEKPLENLVLQESNLESEFLINTHSKEDHIDHIGKKDFLNSSQDLKENQDIKDLKTLKSVKLEDTSFQSTKDCGSWWDIYTKGDVSPEYRSRTVVYDSDCELNNIV